MFYRIQGSSFSSLPTPPVSKGTQAEGARAHATRAAKRSARAAKTAAARATIAAPSQTQARACLSVAAKVAASLAWRFHDVAKSVQEEGEEL